MNYYQNSPVKQSPFETIDSVESRLAWWIEITTAKPYCIYYFGPFDSKAEAVVAQYGYIEDLITEKASGISVEIKTAQPKLLTVCK